MLILFGYEYIHGNFSNIMIDKYLVHWQCIKTLSIYAGYKFLNHSMINILRGLFMHERNKFLEREEVRKREREKRKKESVCVRERETHKENYN